MREVHFEFSSIYWIWKNFVKSMSVKKFSYSGQFILGLRRSALLWRKFPTISAKPKLFRDGPENFCNFSEHPLQTFSNPVWIVLNTEFFDSHWFDEIISDSKDWTKFKSLLPARAFKFINFSFLAQQWLIMMKKWWSCHKNGNWSNRNKISSNQWVSKNSVT